MQTSQIEQINQLNIIKIKSIKKIEDHDENYLNFIIKLCDEVYSQLCKEKIKMKDSGRTDKEKPSTS
jgi:hypothetical protein